MRKNNQHIAFDHLFAFNDGRLDLHKANQCAKHLEVCEECQNTFEAIQEFNTIELRQPHIQYVEKELDENLLNITKEYIRKSHKGIYTKILYCLHERDFIKYCALIAASVLLVFLFSVMNQPKETDEIVEKTEPIDVIMEDLSNNGIRVATLQFTGSSKITTLESIKLDNHFLLLSADSSKVTSSTEGLSGISYNPTTSTLFQISSDSMIEEDCCCPTIPMLARSDSIKKLEWEPYNSSIIAETDISIPPLGLISNSTSILYDEESNNMQIAEDEFTRNHNISKIGWNSNQVTIEETLKRKYQPVDTTNIEKIRITSISPTNYSKLDLIITVNSKLDLALSEKAVKNKVKSHRNLPKESNYTHRSNYTHQSNYRMAH